MNKYDQLYVLGFIAKLIHPKTVKNDLLNYFPADELFFDRLVQIASAHLVLPGIYGAVKHKQLSSYFPEDLITYLAEIQSQNHSRNLKILAQIKFVSDVLNKYNIKHVFLKGAAMLITRPYNTLEQRMVGDIDILIAKDQINLTQKIMLAHGFTSIEGKAFNFTQGLEGFDHRHLERIVHPNFIAAVELHKEPLTNKNNSKLPAQSHLKNIDVNQKFSVTSTDLLWKHAILNRQHNDNGLIKNRISLRTYMDAVYLEPKNFSNNGKDHSSITHFYSLCSVLIDYYSNHNVCSTLGYKLQLKYPVFGVIRAFLIKLSITIPLILNRINLLIKSKVYRQRVSHNPRLLMQRMKEFFGRI